ncbi:Brix-domain-containing protein [Hortaea werneckii]|nr:Brix-domain-containing protein [Hortaea werneckii]KAI7095902.1 Brix-domain-containing protein [Hortaea werneckii]KAI7227202.1 Brix-domain-containing protein [Hortaea werneckii]KAI7325094.1 Brix-domain-containing protein [Hortaea werneckii]
MAKRRVKKRTQAGSKAPAPGNAPHKPGERTPKSMVIRVGASDVGPSITQLVRDTRSMMEPQTATRLKERKSNKLRDYTSMAGPLGVSHLLLFSRSRNGNVNLRLALTPRGPTFHFRVEKYSLCKDVHRSMKRPKSGGNDQHLTAPLLVMNNFTAQQQQQEDQQQKKPHPEIPKHLESLATTVFQSLFPPINPTTTPLKSIKRILLLDRMPPPTDSSAPSDKANYVLQLRHYAIESRTAKSVPKALRRLDAAEKLTHSGQNTKRGALPNLGKLNDVSDYLLDPHAADGFTSDSEPETDAEVEVLAPSTQKLQRKATRKSGADEGSGEGGSGGGGGGTRYDRRDPRGRSNVERKAIKLHELGPRMRLRLTKVEEGLCGGKVMWHEYIHKSAAELREMDKVHEGRRREKEARREEQRRNLERKRAERRGRGEEEVQSGDEEEEEEEMDEDMMDEEDEWEDDGMEGEEE